MTDLVRFIRATTLEPLALERRTLDAFVRMVRGHLIEGAHYDGARIHAELGLEAAASPRVGRRDRAVAVIPIVGTIANRAHSAGPGTDRMGASWTRRLTTRGSTRSYLTSTRPVGPSPASRSSRRKSSRPGR